MIRITELRIPVQAGDDDIESAVGRRLRLGSGCIHSWRVCRWSIDARRSGRPSLVLSVDVDVHDEPAILASFQGDRDIGPTPEARYEAPIPGTAALQHRPVVVGAGPAGLFAALLLARMGYRPLVLERGAPVQDRIAAVNRFWSQGLLDPDSNVQFGEGGAGTFSDGKLTTRIRDPRCRLVLQEMVAAGAPEDILHSYLPHVGTDLLRDVVVRLRNTIVGLGGEVRFNSRVSDFRIESGAVTGVDLSGSTIPVQAVVLAPGHSARDTFLRLRDLGVPMERKPFSIGLRIEHPQAWIDATQFKSLAGHPRLGAASYRLAWHAPDGRGAYTFCMCPGGHVMVASSEQGGVVTNGMSLHARAAPNGNSALVVGVDSADFGGNDVLAGMDFQRRWETLAFQAGGGTFKAPAQTVGDFLAGRPGATFGDVQPSCLGGVASADLSRCLPDFVTATLRQALPAMGHKMHGFDAPDSVLTGVETRTSSPVRILRNETMESSVLGLFPAGEGAGYAGGIMSAATDGLRAAEAIIEKWSPP
jgi:hypothetical protein